MESIKRAVLLLIPTWMLLTPSRISGIVGYEFYSSNQGSILVAFYLLTVLYIAFYLHRGLDKLAILPISFALTSVSVFLVEVLIMEPHKFGLMGTLIVTMLYTIPFTIITIMATAVVAVRRKMEDKRT